MNCPRCKNTLIILELENIETDYCNKCGGIWFDAGELELLSNNIKTVENLLKYFTKDATIKEKSIRCPICNKRMDKVYVDKDKKIIIDECPDGHGLWFDNGEILNLINANKIDLKNSIISLLSEIYNNKITTKTPEEK